MNDLSLSVTGGSRGERHCSEPIPRIAIYVLISLFLIGFGVSTFILAVVHNVIFFLLFLFLSATVVAFVLWNILSFRRNAALLLFLHSSPDSDLRFARHGQLVKITGVISTFSFSLILGSCCFCCSCTFSIMGHVLYL